MSDGPPRWAFFGTILFTIVVPGTVVGVMPFVLTAGWTFGPPLAGEPSRWLGVALGVLATPLFVSFLSRFVREGHGTPAPIAPPQHLVVRGPFRWVRNPGYIAVVSMIVGQGLLFGSWAVLVYAACMALLFHFVVVVWEEPALRRTFGAEYEEYRRRVPRWLPRPGRS